MSITPVRILSLFFIAIAAAPASPVQASSVQASPFPAATPQSQGVSEEALRELSAVVRGYVLNDLAVGTELLVIKNRRTVLHEAYGMSDRERSVAMVPGTIFNLRSMTKMFTGAAIQILIDEGDLELEMKAADFLEGFRNPKSESITIGELLAHRAGLQLSILIKAGRLDAYHNLIEMADAVGAGGPEFPPDSKFWYSDSGTDVLAAIVEVVSGKSIAQFVSERLFNPLGMSDTFYLSKTTPHDASRVASLYFGEAGAWTRLWSALDPPIYPYPWGSQTAFGTLEDYARFLAMLLDHGKSARSEMGEGKEVLTNEAIERILTPRSLMSELGSDAPFPTGFRGLTPWYGQMSVLHLPTSPPTANPAEKAAAKPVVIGHSGSDGTIAWAFPDRDLMILFFTQSRGGLTPIRLETEIDRLLLHPGVPDAAPASRLAPYVGRYHIGFSEVRVLARDDQLAIDVPDSLVFDLVEPADGKAWKAPRGGFSITFERDPKDAAVTSLTFHAGTNTRKYLAGAAPAEIFEKAERLAALAGDYREEETQKVNHFQVEGARLAVVLAGRPGELTLRAPDEAGWREMISDQKRAVRFDVMADGTVPSLTWRSGAVESKWKRVPAKADGH